VLHFTLIVAFPVPNVPLERPHHSAGSVTRAGKAAAGRRDKLKPDATADNPTSRAQMVLWFSRYAAGDADWLSERQGKTDALIYGRRHGR
jgi:hypothetical protein